MKSRFPLVASIIWLILSAGCLWWIPKPWNFIVGIISVVVFFLLPDVKTKGIRRQLMKKDTDQIAWNKIQFLAWYSIIFGGILAIGAVRLKASVINPLNVSIDLTLALLLATSTFVFLVSDWARRSGGTDPKTAKANFEASLSFSKMAFTLLTITFLAAQVDVLWIYLKTTVPALLVNYPTVSWGLAVIYLVSGVAAAATEILKRGGEE